ncbi:MAG: transcription-repair coupling factor [Acidobacteriota bacterium]|nr:MAG: transcription-repair coupling factor [Acidobacteriota bacterium]
MSRQIEQISNLLGRGERIVSVSGLTSSSAKAFVLARLFSVAKRKFAVIVDSNAELDRLAADIDVWLTDPADAATGPKGPRLVTLPSFDTDPYSGVSPHAETQERRALALWQIANGDADIVILTARSLVQKIPSKKSILELGVKVVRDEDYPIEKVSEKLFAAGYIREEPIYGPGQFSVRGGIMDVWPPDLADPVRIEFFGDTVDSIRTFDPDTQLSVEQLREADIAPMREFAATPQDLRDWAFFAEQEFADENFSRNLRDRTEIAAEGATFSGWEFLIPLVKPLDGSVFDHLSDFTLIADEPAFLEDLLSSFYETQLLHHSQTVESGDIGLEPSRLFVEQKDLQKWIEKLPRIELRSLGRAAAGTDEEFQQDSSPLFLFPSVDKAEEIEILSRATRRFRGDVPAFVGEFDPRGQIVVSTPGMADRLTEILREYDIYLPVDSIKVGGLSSGFELPSEDVLFYTESDIFGETEEIQRPNAGNRRPKSRLGAFISDFRDLKPGDYVVHVDHGIGRFDGLQTIASQGSEREFMLLIYADNAKLFVPVERMDLVSRYSSGESTQPSLDRLGGIGWQKTKAKAKRAMRDMADELLKLYAERKLVRGHAFPPDAPWQHEFEDAFPYKLTVDQASAIEDVKSDMEAPVPMDRLIIGDVGYGKTEVAMRAAFKAVMDGKQAVVLTPTTVLAYQHYETFKKRFAAFPVSIELMSRFRTTKEQKSVAETAAKGEVDVLIGTHRVLSNDIKLPKLGLVIVDEEQRFGVGHKEKLKHLKKKVDVLTLSATPIPRTLNMSLLGMRDMSVIETPPRDRLAINTQVVQFSEGVIRSAIELEMSRNGQVFFIHNRVESIQAIAALIQKIVPDARVAIGHGQMNEKEMEQVMLDFIDYKYDILVATTIIENGIDIPRANTIIINRADNYGLSQLYQLRGRVGRSNRRAYAYLLIPSELELTPIARRRLSAIREFSDLGAGFRLAALDLELRGAGNILGGQQSGHLDALGFDLYTKMLERTIAEIRGDAIADEISVSINLGVDVSIPKDYIVEAAQRLRTYKRIASAETDAELAAIHDEIADRYGRIPHSVERLFDYGRLRKLAEKIGIVSVDKTADGVAIKLGESARVSPDKLMSLLGEVTGAAFSPGGILRLPVLTADPIKTAFDALRAIAEDHSVQS